LRVSKYGGMVVVLSTIALALATSSLTLPFFRVSFSDTDVWTGYTDHVVNHEYEISWYHSDDAIGHMMHNLELIVLVWSLLAIIFIVTVIADYRFLSLLLGWILVVTAVNAVSYFFVVMSQSTRGITDGPIHGFMGSQVGASGGIWLWGPSLGWWTLLLACVIQTGMVVTRTFIVLSSIKDNPSANDWPPVPPA